MSAPIPDSNIPCDVSLLGSSSELTSLQADATPANESSQSPVPAVVVKSSGHTSCARSVLRAICMCLCPEDEPMSSCYLPRKSISSFGKKTLVLDLDETLVYCTLTVNPKADAILPVTIQNQETSMYVKKRPGLDRFLEGVSELFELVLFTASMAHYAVPVLSEIDPNGVINHALFREHCDLGGNGFVKDLSKLGRDLQEVIIVDVILT